ncbi:MAG: TIGR02186 family protein [Rhizobiaceae bacterium]|nr:TIGR02186 family protein [Rhizobiaceae bacterium]
MFDRSFHIQTFVLALVVSLFALTSAHGEELQIGVSVDNVPVSSSFSGTRIFVFGSIEDPEPTAVSLYEYTVLVTVKGPARDLVVRKKQRVLGVWVNRRSRTYGEVPGFYTVVSAKPVQDSASKDVLKKNKLGVSNLDFYLIGRDRQTLMLKAPEFSAALNRIRADEELFTEQDSGLSFIGKTLFRAAVELPANVPIGTHEVTAHLLLKGEIIDTKTASFTVAKVGFERWIYELAHENSFLYGLMAVLLAISTGWLANVLFRRD